MLFFLMTRCVLLCEDAQELERLFAHHLSSLGRGQTREPCVFSRVAATEDNVVIHIGKIHTPPPFDNCNCNAKAARTRQDTPDRVYGLYSRL